jgi:hypothetical protein
MVRDALGSNLSWPFELLVESCRRGHDSELEADLAARGWRLRRAHGVTATYGADRGYIGTSRGEFSVGMNVFVTSCPRSSW